MFANRSHLESKLKVFNQYYEGKSGGIRSREVSSSTQLYLELHCSEIKILYLRVYVLIHLKIGQWKINIRRCLENILGCSRCYSFERRRRSAYCGYCA